MKKNTTRMQKSIVIADASDANLVIIMAFKKQDQRTLFGGNAKSMKHHRISRCILRKKWASRLTNQQVKEG